MTGITPSVTQVCAIAAIRDWFGGGLVISV